MYPSTEPNAKLLEERLNSSYPNEKNVSVKLIFNSGDKNANHIFIFRSFIT